MTQAMGDPHALRHTFVDNWLRNGGSEVDLARLAGWTSTAMASRYAQHRAAERAITAHRTIAPLDRI
jgi:integrase